MPPNRGQYRPCDRGTQGMMRHWWLGGGATRPAAGNWLVVARS
jgi:hypothetical protein